MPLLLDTAMDPMDTDALFKQLHLVQEELERLHTERKQLGLQGVGWRLEWVDDELPAVLAENQRLQLIIEAQKKIMEVESSFFATKLACRLDSILLQHMRSASGLVKLPGKLLRAWRAMTQTTPPKALGGKAFSAVIKAYEQDGMVGVDNLLDTVAISPTMQANAYTALARHLMYHNAEMAVEAARRAYEADPRAYRLKWLGFRLYDAGALLEAEAILEVLPLDVFLKESEVRQKERIRFEARQIREKRARQLSDYKTRKETIRERIRELTQAKEQAHALATERATEIERLIARQVELERHNTTLNEQYREQVALVNKCQAELRQRARLN
jgi:ATPase involved in DNA repair